MSVGRRWLVIVACFALTGCAAGEDAALTAVQDARSAVVVAEQATRLRLGARATTPYTQVVLDDSLVPETPDFPHVVRIPITKLAIEQVGKPLFANIVALGALVRLTELVSFDTIKQSVAHRVPPHTVEQNMKALQVGWDAAGQV